MPNTFDEANQATEELFNDDQQLTLADAEQVPNEPPAPAEPQEQASETPETPPEGVPAGNPQDMIADAANTAEAAAQAAAQSAQELEVLRRQNEQLQGQNQQLQSTIEELLKINQQNIVEEALEPPILDINGLAFADEETVKAAQEQYATQMSEYTRKQMMKELSPAIEYAKEGMREKEKSETLSILAQIPELQGIQDMIPQLDRIIANNKWLQSDDMPMDEKYINAFAMAKGVNSIRTAPAPAKEPTTEELMELYNNNPEFQELVEKQRLEQIKQSQQVPPFSASSGAVNAALNIPEKPKDWNEASRRTREMFGAV